MNLFKFNLLPKKEKVLSKKGKSLPKLNFLYSLTQLNIKWNYYQIELNYYLSANNENKDLGETLPYQKENYDQFEDFLNETNWKNWKNWKNS